jgi:hypothetical protein
MAAGMGLTERMRGRKAMCASTSRSAAKEWEASAGEHVCQSEVWPRRNAPAFRQASHRHQQANQGSPMSMPGATVQHANATKGSQANQGSPNQCQCHSEA